MFNKFMSFYNRFFLRRFIVEIVEQQFSPPSLILNSHNFYYDYFDATVMTLCMCPAVHIEVCKFYSRDKILMYDYGRVFCFSRALRMRVYIYVFTCATAVLQCVWVVNVSLFSEKLIGQSHSAVLIKKSDQLKPLQQSVIHF